MLLRQRQTQRHRRTRGMGYCHCSSCRSWSAGPVNAFTLWKPDSVTVTEGADQIGTFNLTPHSFRKWCKNCGGHLFTEHPRFHMHFTPTSSSWLNMVERFFRNITDKRIRRGVFKSVADLKAAIAEYIAVHNAKPKPLIWTAKASDILAKVTRARAVLNKSSYN